MNYSLNVDYHVIPEKVKLESLKETGKLLDNEIITQRHQDHADVVKIGKKSLEEFSTVLAETHLGAKAIFALYRGKEAICGKGSFGRVKLAQNLTTGEWCAVKIFYKDPNFIDEWSDLRAQAQENELYILRSLQMLKGRAVRVDEKKNKVVTYVFMEYVHGRHINNRMASNTGDFLAISIGAVQSLKELHNLGYLHRDIKRDNMLYDPNSKKFRLIDFGSAMPLNQANTVIVSNTFGLTTSYSSWKKEDGNYHLSVYTDMYLLGSILRDIWSSVLENYRENEIPVDKQFRKDVYNVLDKMASFSRLSFSEITANQAEKELLEINERFIG